MAIGLLVIPAMAIAFAISFAALVFKGPLEPFLGQGISLTLISAAILGLLGSFLFSFRGTISGPQDVTSILLGAAALTIVGTMTTATPADILGTSVVFFALGSITAGIASLVFGWLRLGYLARFMPYPVIGGFLAATGYLLFVSSVGMMLGEEVSAYTAWHVLSTAPLIGWLPWVLAAAGIIWAQRKGAGVYTLPLTMIACIAFFYAALAATGQSLSDVEHLLLGPFEEVALGDLTQIGLSADINWTAILTQIPTLIAVAGLTILGTLLNSTGIELSVKEDSGFERDLRATGISNIGAGLLGGLPGYQLIGETLLARNFGLPNRLPGIMAALGCLLALLFGTPSLGYTGFTGLSQTALPKMT